LFLSGHSFIGQRAAMEAAHIFAPSSLCIV
jgi:hypothetical protein